MSSRNGAHRSAASSAFARRVSCKKLFAAWDTDGSGTLEFAELRAVFAPGGDSDSKCAS